MGKNSRQQATGSKQRAEGICHSVSSRGLRFAFYGLLPAACCLLFFSGCRTITESRSARPRSLRDVPATRLAYRFEADTASPAPEEESANLEAIQKDFDTRRKEERLVRTIVSPDGQIVLALYETSAEQAGEFRIDMYSADGQFLRNLTPPTLSCEFEPSVRWSPDGNYLAFIGRKTPAPGPTPLDLPVAPPLPAAPTPEPSVAPTTAAPLFSPLVVFGTEQIYICNRYGEGLKPLTTRDGLIYFYLTWAPDAHALAALACKEDEWNMREREHKTPAGRPRLIELTGQERLLDDELAEAWPVWSPDASKVATAFGTSIGIYDALTATPTAARINLHDPLLEASFTYEENRKKKTTANSQSANSSQPAPRNGTPVSFNPIVRLRWPQPETLLIETAYVRIYANEPQPVTSFQRWHTLYLSPQAALLSLRQIFKSPRALAAL